MEQLPKNLCPWWKKPKGIITMLILTTIGLYLIIVHKQHVIGALPFLVILICPLMHIFMHRGHKHHGKDKDSK